MENKVESQPQMTPRPVAPQVVPGRGLGIAALVVGIVAFIGGWVPFWGFITGATAVILGILSLKKKVAGSTKGMAIAGLATGAAGALWCLIVTAIFLVAIAGISQASTDSTTGSSANSATAKQLPTTRQVAGTQATLGAGTFTVGQDVQPGLYDVAPGSGQSGNFIVNGQDSYNEVLGVSDGFGVSKVRAELQKGDQVEIDTLNQVTFTPVTAAFETGYQATSLYAGTFTVGEDIAPGRYVVTPGNGQSGNFIVDGHDEYDEILGGDGVSNVTATLTKGDVITISGLDQVNFAVTQ